MNFIEKVKKNSLFTVNYGQKYTLTDTSMTYKLLFWQLYFFEKNKITYICGRNQ